MTLDDIATSVRLANEAGMDAYVALEDLGALSDLSAHQHAYRIRVLADEAKNTLIQLVRLFDQKIADAA
jgi:hypothetical protein